MSRTSIERAGAFREIVLGPAESPAATSVSREARVPRFFTLPEAVDPVAVFSRLRVAVLGVGAVGRGPCLDFARLGVETLWICDRGAYKTESIVTQPIDPDEVGRSKAEVVGRLAKRVSPSTHVLVHDGPFESLCQTTLADADLVLMATDNIRAELECGQRCLHLGKPLVQASVHGGTLTAHVRFYGNRPAGGPCPACGLTGEERLALAREVVFSCDGANRDGPRPTMSTAHLCGLAGNLAFNQVLRHVLNLGPAVVDREVEWNGVTLQTHVAPLARNPRCPADHVVWRSLSANGRLSDWTLRELARAAGMHDDGRLERAAFRVGRTVFAERGVCCAGHGQAVERFVAPGEPAGACSTCSRPLAAEPFFTQAAAPARLLTGRLDRPLRELCAEPPGFVLVGEGSETTLFRPDAAGGKPRRAA